MLLQLPFAMYTLHTLKNNIKLITAPLHETQAVTVLVLVKVGSRYESAKLNGASHFIEHLLFKGTKKRPTSLDITKELDGVGADYNAFTSKDHTGYYIKVNHEKLELAMDIVSDMLFNSLFEQLEIEKERGVILEEINMFEDNPIMLIDSVFEEAIFKGNSLADRISGPKKNIKNISRTEIIKYFNDHYNSANVLVGIAGRFNNQKVKKLVKKYFGKANQKTKRGPFKSFRVSQTKPRVSLITKKTEQVQVALGYPAFKFTDPKLYPLSLLSIILGGNMSSRLFLEIREKLGLAYYIRSGLTVYEDTGALVVYAGLDKTKINLALKTIIKELKKTVSEKVTAEELIRAKEYIKGKLILHLEDSASLVQWLATQQLLKKKITTLDEQLKKIEKVNVSQIQKVANEVIKDSKINLGVIGPFNKKEKFLNILS